MWIMTTGGFVSAVADHLDPQILKVRARDRESLETMRQGIAQITDTSLDDLKIITGEGTDYPYRVYVGREDFAAWVAREVMVCLTYTNYKNALKKTRGERWATLASKIWTVLLDWATDTEGEKVMQPYYGRGYVSRPLSVQEYLLPVGYKAPEYPEPDYGSSIFPEYDVEQDVPEDAVFWEAERAAMESRYPRSESDWFLSDDNLAALYPAPKKKKKSKGRTKRIEREERTLRGV